MRSVSCYIVTYDISDPKRWRQVFKLLQGYGEHVQLSVFRCDLDPLQVARLTNALRALIHHREDQVILLRLGPSNEHTLREITVIGKPREFSLPGPVVV
ncbi:MAG: CRISPR-associated endonuclease Cas2 [Candidatus Bipolaricaulota bacterium]|nr:CRISPR-associated endonuclease Cas2 [Candidatus Bipolaricaulota bacterium]MDW7967306.1 CRISPR-associated endonuclease Cas2 [Thermoanaerobaculum sp.]MDW8127525.1 CRISPR-associated endonuclease Cas2 [Candidatus Bipolaricaulota bacterium]